MRNMKKRVNKKVQKGLQMNMKYYLMNLKLSEHAKMRYRERTGKNLADDQMLQDIENKLATAKLLYSDGIERHYGTCSGEIFVIKNTMINCESVNLVVTVLLNKAKQLSNFSSRADRIDYDAMGRKAPATY